MCVTVPFLFLNCTVLFPSQETPKYLQIDLISLDMYRLNVLWPYYDEHYVDSLICHLSIYV